MYCPVLGLNCMCIPLRSRMGNKDIIMAEAVTDKLEDNK